MIVIVYGALRSGTTLLRLMLDMHPRLNCPGEADFLFDHLSFDDDGGVRLDRAALEGNRIYQASGVKLNPDLEPVAAVQDMVRQMQDAKADRLVLMLHRHVAEALRIFPQAVTLHMLRDPRDVAQSAIGMGWAGTAYHGAIYWIRTELDWDRMRTEHPNAAVQELRYESLISAPEHTLEGLCAFLDVVYDSEMLNYAAGSTYAAPDASLVEQWRRKQTPQSVGLVEARLGPMLASRGYVPSGYASVQPGKLLSMKLWGQDKWAVWRLRIARYGMIDPILVGLSRRLGRPALARNAQTRMNLKQVRYLK